MASDNEPGALKTFIQTISPFISFAIMLIGFIYVQGMNQTQADFKKVADGMEKRDAAITASSNAILIVTNTVMRLEKNDEKQDARIEANEKRLNDLEKIVILSNANRR